VEASEAGRRIFWRHRWLLIILMILPGVGVFGLKEHQPVTYAATATIQGQGTTPDATTQVTAIQSRVTAVATAPAWVQSAISNANVSRDALQVARHEISVTPLSSSAIMLVTVTDPNRQVAIALAGSLATVVVNELNQLGVQDNPELVALSKTNTSLALRRNQLLSELNGANSANATTSVPVQSLLSQLGAAEQELAANRAEQPAFLASSSLPCPTCLRLKRVRHLLASSERHRAPRTNIGSIRATVVQFRGLLWPGSHPCPGTPIRQTASTGTRLE